MDFNFKIRIRDRRIHIIIQDINISISVLLCTDVVMKAKRDVHLSKARKVNQALKELANIDKKHESGKYTKQQHDVKSKRALEKYL